MPHRPRILHLEDNPNDAALVKNLLAADGLDCEMLVVQSRADFAAALDQGHFDLIISDYTLPSYDGHAALLLAREKRPDVPFLFFSGTIGEDAAIEALNAGATDYVLKERPSRLVAAVRRAMAEAKERAERKRAEEALRESVQRFQQLAESIQEVFWMTSPDMQEVLYVSPAYEKVWGRSLATLYQRPLDWIDAILPDDRPRTVEAFGSLAQGEAMVSIEYRIRRPDGSIRWIHDRGFAIRNEAGQVYRTAGAALDITERKQIEAREALQVAVSLILSESSTLADAAPRLIQAICETTGWELGAVWLVDRAAHALRCQSLWHVPSLQAEEFVAKSRAITFAPGVGMPGRVWASGASAWIPDVLRDANFPRAPVAAKAGLHGAWGIPIRSGRETVGVLEFFSHEVREPDESLLHMMADIGIKIGQFVERKTLEAQLLQAQKMDAVGQLAGGIAHDFNNLLTVINGYSEMILERLKPADPLHQEVEQIKAAGQRASALTNQILAFSRRQILAPKILDLNAVVSGAETMLRRLIGEHMNLSLSLAPSLGPVKADPGQIEQVIVNLVVNARDAMPEGGQLTIETKNVELDEVYARQHQSVQPGRYVLFSVTDTGHGMDAATLSRIFEPFFTTKEQGKGTGLGLSTVYGIVKQSDGHIWVYSELGKGTSFKIYLPLVQAAEEIVTPAERKAATLGGSETVLVVEDEPLVRTLAKTVLRKYGYAVLEAGNGEEALRVAQTHKAPINLLVTDMTMPDMNGQELARRLVLLTPTIKVLFTSGYTDQAIARNSQFDPSGQFLQKPFTAEVLARKVREVLDAPRNQRGAG